MFAGWGGKPSEGEKALNTMKEAAAPVDQPKGKKSMHGFDPEALERAAKAARELDNSRNAREASNIIQAQEVTKQKEQEAERAKYQAMQQQLAIQRIAEEEASAARTLEKQVQQDKQKADYRHQLERQQMAEQINAKRQLNEEERKKTEESLLRQEAIRRKTLEHEAELRQKTELARAAAEAEGRILQERKNHDLVLEKKRVEAKEYRETLLESIKQAGTTIGGFIQDFASDRQKLGNVAGTITLIALGIYATKTGMGVAGRYVESRLGKPSLVRETSKQNYIQMVKSPFSTLKSFISKTDPGAAMKDVVLEAGLSNRLKRVAVSTANTKKNRAPFRHLLLHGPPGTGKTMFAKGLAKQSGLDYAIMTGGDVAPLGKDAVTEIHKIFDWAQGSSKGVLIFVDEADAFLRKRSTEHISEDMRNALNAFLYRTGEASHKFMIVYASNQPEQFDWAINDRIDEMVEFRLPSYDERLRMISNYMNKYLLNPPAGSKQIVVNGVDEAVMTSIATATEGFSGREISKLAIAWQAAAYGTENATIDVELLTQVLRENQLTKKQKNSWISRVDAERLTRDAIA